MAHGSRLTEELSVRPQASSLEPQAVVRVFVAALLLYLGTTGGSLSSTDAVVMFDLTQSLVEHRSIALSGNVLGFESNRGSDGRYYSQYGIGQSIVNVPFYLAGRAVERAMGARLGKPDSQLKAAVSLSSAVAAAAAVAVIFLLAMAMLDNERAALISAALAGTGSLLWPYARFGFNAPLTALIVAAMTLLVWRGAKDDRPALIAWAGWLAGFGWLTRHEFPLVIAPVALWIVVTAPRSDRWKRVMAFLPGVATGGLLWSAYNLTRFGRPLFVGYKPYYTGDGFYGLLLSPGGSVFLFWPALVLCLAGLLLFARTQRNAAWLLAIPTIATFGYAALLLDWPGGRSYGPRYLVPALPVLTVGVGWLYARAGLAGRRWIGSALVVSALLQLPGVLVDYSRVSQAWASTATDDQLSQRLYRWDSSPLVLNTEAAVAAVPLNIAYLTGRAPVPPLTTQTDSADRGFAQQFAFSLDFWWLYLFYLGALPAAVAVGLGLAMWSGAAIVGTHAWRATDARQA